MGEVMVQLQVFRPGMEVVEAEVVMVVMLVVGFRVFLKKMKIGTTHLLLIQIMVALVILVAEAVVEVVRVVRVVTLTMITACRVMVVTLYNYTGRRWQEEVVGEVMKVGIIMEQVITPFMVVEEEPQNSQEKVD